MKKGFTLIEVLAVVLILGLIMVIAIPTVSKIVKMVREKAFKISVGNIVRKIEYDCESEQFRGKDDLITYTFTKDGVTPSLNIKGKLPTAGTITVDGSCNTEVNVEDDIYVVVKPKDGELESSLVNFSSLKEKTDDLIKKASSYKYMEGTYLKGSQEFNYVWFSGNLYRIMGRDENNNIRLISQDAIASIPSTQENPTYVLFKTTYISDWLNNYFYDHINNSLLANTPYCMDLASEGCDPESDTCNCLNEERNYKIALISLPEYFYSIDKKKYSVDNLSFELFSKLDTYPYYYYLNNTYNGSKPLSLIDFEDYLVRISKNRIDYITAILESYGIDTLFEDENKNVTIDHTYLNDNYTSLYTSLNLDTSDKKYYSISFLSRLDNYPYEYLPLIYPVVTLSASTSITGGNGTKTSPITVEDMDEKDGTLYDNAKSGEYVELEGIKYRISENIEDVGTKVVLNGILADIDTYNNMITNMSNNVYLSNLGLTLDDSRLVDYTWDIGNYFTPVDNYTKSFESSQNKFTSKVGGLKVGEMYSLISYSTENKFTYSSFLLTQFDLNNSYSTFGSIGKTERYGIRPALVITPDTIITGGNGTYESPYEI